MGDTTYSPCWRRCWCSSVGWFVGYSWWYDATLRYANTMVASCNCCSQRSTKQRREAGTEVAAEECNDMVWLLFCIVVSRTLSHSTTVSRYPFTEIDLRMLSNDDMLKTFCSWIVELVGDPFQEQYVTMTIHFWYAPNVNITDMIPK